MMTVTLNKKSCTLPDNTTLADVAVQMKVPAKGAAIAVNGAVVHREQWSSTTVSDGDDILVIKAFCGG